jgi:hypothetical protein
MDGTCSYHLGVSELLNTLSVSCEAWIDKSEFLHTDHVFSMLSQMLTEVSLEHEQLLF